MQLFGSNRGLASNPSSNTNARWSLKTDLKSQGRNKKRQFDKGQTSLVSRFCTVEDQTAIIYDGLGVGIKIHVRKVHNNAAWRATQSSQYNRADLAVQKIRFGNRLRGLRSAVKSPWSTKITRRFQDFRHGKYTFFFSFFLLSMAYTRLLTRGFSHDVYISIIIAIYCYWITTGYWGYFVLMHHVQCAEH